MEMEKILDELQDETYVKETIELLLRKKGDMQKEIDDQITKIKQFRLIYANSSVARELKNQGIVHIGPTQVEVADALGHIEIANRELKKMLSDLKKVDKLIKAYEKTI